MELFRTKDFYIFRQAEHSLWCCRKTGRLEPKTGNGLILNHSTSVNTLFITFLFCKYANKLQHGI